MGKIHENWRYNFLQWEEANRDGVWVRKVYVDLAGDLIAGVLLSQIIYWFLPSKAGGSKLRITVDGEQWLAKRREDWWGECRIRPRQFDRALAILVERDLVKTMVAKFDGSPTVHVTINWAWFMQALETQVGGALSPVMPFSPKTGAPDSVISKSPIRDNGNYETVISKSPIGENHGNHETGISNSRIGDNHTITETTAETTPKTTHTGARAGAQAASGWKTTAQLDDQDDDLWAEEDTAHESKVDLFATVQVTERTVVEGEVIMPGGLRAALRDVTPGTYYQNLEAMMVDFKREYPKAGWGDWGDAMLMARELNPADWMGVVQAARHYAKSSVVQRGKILNAVNFLRGGRWQVYEDGPIIEKENDNGRQHVSRATGQFDRFIAETARERAMGASGGDYTPHIFSSGPGSPGRDAARPDDR